MAIAKLFTLHANATMKEGKHLEHKLRIFEIEILKTKGKKKTENLPLKTASKLNNLDLKKS